MASSMHSSVSPSKIRGTSTRVSSSSSSSSQANRRGRCTPVYTIVLLVLSHSVWNTLQCTTRGSSSSSSSSENQDPSSGVIVVETEQPFEGDNELIMEEETSSVQSYGNGYRDSSNRGLVTVPGKKDVDRRQQQYLPPREEIQRLCNYRLFDSVRTACGDNNFYIPSASEEFATILNSKRGNIRKRSAMGEGQGEGRMQRRWPRSLVNECCKKPCQPSYFLRFCQNKKGLIPRPTTTPNSSQSEVTEINEQPQENVQFPPAPSSPEEPEPALYTAALFHLFNLIHKQLSPKHSAPSNGGGGDTTIVVEDQGNMVGGEDGERDLPMPEAFIQDQHQPSSVGHHHRQNNQRIPSGNQHQLGSQQQQVHSSNTNFHTRPRYQGNNGNHNAGHQMGDNGAASFNTNLAPASHNNNNNNQQTNNQGHQNRHHHHNYRSSFATNTVGASSTSAAAAAANDDERMINNNLQPYPIHQFPNPQQGQQANDGEATRMSPENKNVHILTRPPHRDVKVRWGNFLDDDIPPNHEIVNF